MSPLVLLALLPFLAWFALVRAVVVREWERGLLYRYGRFARVLAPGVHLVLRPGAAAVLVDVRVRATVVAGQEVLTADQLPVRASLVVTWAVQDPAKAVHTAADYATALYLATQVALRDAVALEPLEGLVQGRAALGARLLEQVAPAGADLGLHVTAVEVRDFGFPAELKRAWTEVIRARKEGEAALERARGEQAALRKLANAARMLDDNPSLARLRGLQVVEQAGARPGTTLVVGVPAAWTPP